MAGWALNDAVDGASSARASGVSTACGLTIGSTRAELYAAYALTIEETSLGTVLAAGDLYGLLDDEGGWARVTALWAGASCDFW